VNSNDKRRSTEYIRKENSIICFLKRLQCASDMRV